MRFIHIGTNCLAVFKSTHRTNTLTGWSIFGMPINVWSPSICPVRLRYLSWGLGGAWAFATRIRICLDLFTWFLRGRDDPGYRFHSIAKRRAYHQYQPLTKRGNNDIGSNFNDDPHWLVIGVAAYFRERGVEHS